MIADADGLEALVSQIAAGHPVVADALTVVVADYGFDRIVQWAGSLAT